MEITPNPERHYIIGMAGHIDHGKTALVEALTGIWTDRLKEEQERGITIDLGFAHFSRNVTIIDVPGHEKLIKNMVAGVSTIDLVLFVVAADDGVMPQTREHLDIVRLLGITNSIFVITKTDLVEEEWLLLVEEDLRILLKNNGMGEAPILKVSSRSGAGIEELRVLLEQKLKEIAPRFSDGIFRLPVDRVFSKAGFGTVVTGTVLSGEAAAGEMLEVQPEGIEARLRGLQSHDSAVQQVSAGYRAALNLAGVDQQQLHRGQVLADPGYFQAAEVINARVQLMPDSPQVLKNRTRVRFHIHTAETLARVILIEGETLQPGNSALVQFRLEHPVHAAFRDRFI
ncbi:MAG: selenocysteine-specific translation elongation factor, partial [Calditrichia bacterium]